jgi:hypothetical protein
MNTSLDFFAVIWPNMTDNSIRHFHEDCHGWTTDILAARRYNTAEEAEAMMAGLYGGTFRRKGMEIHKVTIKVEYELQKTL